MPLKRTPAGVPRTRNPAAVPGSRAQQVQYTPLLGAAAGTSATSASAAGVAIVQGSAVATSATSATASGRATVLGSAAGTSATSAAATGAATSHVYQGSAAGSSATSASAGGTATPHQYSGTAAATSASSASATGVVTIRGSAAGTSATTGAASGTATPHQYSGSAAGSSATSASSAGIASNAWGSCYSPDFRAASQVGAAAGTSAANDRRLVELVGGTPTFILDSIDTGRYALRCNAASEIQNFSLSPVATTPRYVGCIFRFKIVSADLSANHHLLAMVASTVGETIDVRVNATTGLLAYSFNNSSTYTATSVAISRNVVYALEVFVDWGTGTTHTLKIRLNGNEIVNVTGGTAAVTGKDAKLGQLGILAAQIDYADAATYNGDAPYGTIGGDWRVLGLEPVSDGTHNFTDNDFQDAASANITAANVAAKNTWDMVNDAPTAAPSTTDHIKQVVLRSTSYMEWNLRQMPLTGYRDPLLVCLVAAMHPVGAATANTAGFRLLSGANASAEAAIDTSVATDTLEYRKHHYRIEPVSGSLWTIAMARALAIRFGYSGDATPPPAVDSAMVFVLVPVYLLVSGTGSGTSATSASGVGRATRYGSAAGTSATSASATGVATHHQYAGSAAATSPTAGTASGTATPHQYAGAAAATSATSAAASGTATSHVYAGSGSSTSATGATGVGSITRIGSGSATSATSAAAVGAATSHQYTGSASATSPTSATAAGIATNHVYAGSGSGTSPTSATAAGQIIGVAQGTSTSPTSGTASGLLTIHGVGLSTSATSATAIGEASAYVVNGTGVGSSGTSASATGVESGAVLPDVTGRAGGTPFIQPVRTRILYEALGAHARSRTYADAYGVASPGQRQREEDELLLLRLLGLVR